jgi:mannosyltransferase OCH1-like enzyme
MFFLMFAVCGGQPLFTTDKSCGSWKYEKQWAILGYRPTCLGDNEIKELVHQYCWGRPRQMIQYSDIARLLILYKHGGWYVDSDVRPTPLCISTKLFSDTTFGLESNFESDAQADGYNMLRKSLSLWSIYGKRGDKRLLQNACILAERAMREQAVGESRQAYIFWTTGPSIQTQLWNGSVLPVSVFGCGQHHSNSPSCASRTCWGCHTFGGRWL